ncbi:MAG: hypothetical protein ACFFB5_11720 [Promethearchaeota archaeon]
MNNRSTIRLFIVGILILTFFLSQNSLWTSKSNDQRTSPLKFSLTKEEEEEYITFGDLQNSTNYKVVGSDPSAIPGEFHNVQVNITLYAISIWFNTTKPLFNIINHNENDIDLVFRASKGNRKFQWIVMKFLQIETNTWASIIWNDTGDVTFQGDWKSQRENPQEERGSLQIPGTRNKITNSVSFFSMSILLDKNIMKSDIQNLHWRLELMRVVEEKKSPGFSLFPSIITLIIFFVFFRKRKK